MDVISQVATRYDSVDVAREMIYNQRIPEALNILDKLDKNYPSDENVMLLYSQALYWNNDFPQTIAYIKINSFNKSNSEQLNFHFGKILFELYYLKDASKFLSLYLDKNPDDTETLIMLAKIDYWQGKSPKETLNKIQIILNKDPLNIQARELKAEVLLHTSPELSLLSSYYSDSQPIRTYNQIVNLRLYHSAWFQPSLKINFRHYETGEQIIMPSVSNKTYFSKSKTAFELGAGFFSNSWSDDIIPTWTIGVKQKTVQNIDVSVEASRIPYLFTLASIAENVVPAVMTGSIGRDSGEGITGKLMMQQWHFNDDNKVKTLSAWMLIPFIKKSNFTFNLGYAYTASDSDQNRFVLDETVDLPTYATNGQVLPGVFSPYFTPQNQVVHAALGKIDLKISQKLSASINSNIGVYAHIDNPNYIYYGTTAPTAPSTNPRNPNWIPPIEEELIQNNIHKVFVPTRYLPLDLRGKLIMDLNKMFSIHTEYAYIETIFFKNQELNLGFKWKLAKM